MTLNRSSPSAASGGFGLTPNLVSVKIEFKGTAQEQELNCASLIFSSRFALRPCASPLRFAPALRPCAALGVAPRSACPPRGTRLTLWSSALWMMLTR